MSKSKRRPVFKANASETTVSVDYAKILKTSEKDDRAPIDQFYQACRQLIVRSSGAESWLINLLVLDLISATETYFRRILSGAIRVCPLARDHAGSQQIQFGAAQYFNPHEMELALLEGALSGEGGLKKKVNSLTGFSIVESTSVATALSDFEKACQIRHSIVHSRGEINYRNASELDIHKKPPRLTIQLDGIEFQNIVAICRNAVRALNNTLYSEILDRWIERREIVGRWEYDQHKINPLHALFFSTEDSGAQSEDVYNSKIVPAIADRWQ